MTDQEAVLTEEETGVIKCKIKFTKKQVKNNEAQRPDYLITQHRKFPPIPAAEATYWWTMLRQRL